MSGDSHAMSAQLLRQVLDGVPVAVAAASARMSPSAADQRIKRLARQLQVTVGVEHVAEQVNPTTRLLRTNRAAYLEALEHFDPTRVARDARIPTPDDLQLMLDRIRRGSRQPERDAALLMLLFGTGVRPAELLRLQVRDYLAPDGTSRLVSTLRPEATVDGRSRPLYFNNPCLARVLDAYLAVRARRAGARDLVARRTPDLDSPLVLACSEPLPEPFTQQRLHRTLRGIFQLAGTPGLSSLSARKYVANRLTALGVDEREIGRVMGLRNVAKLRALLVKTPRDGGMRRLL